MKKINQVIGKNLIKAKSLYILMGMFAAFAYKGSRGDNIYGQYHEIMNTNLLIFVYIPLFILMNTGITKIIDRHALLLRFTSIRQWWRFKLKWVMAISFGVISLSCVAIISSILLGDNMRQVDSHFVLYCLYGAGIQWLGLLSISLCYHIIMLIFEKEYISVIVPLLFIMVTDRIKFMFSIREDAFYTFGEIMVLQHVSNNQAIGIFELMILVIVMCLTGIIVYLGETMAEDKEFYWEE